MHIPWGPRAPRELDEPFLTRSLISVMEKIVYLLVSGITYGCIYALFALGINVVYAPTRLFNFAHGEVVIVGAFISYTLIVFGHIPIPLVFIITIIVTAIFSVIVGIAATKPLPKSRVSMGWIFSILGIGIIIRNIVMLIFGDQPINYPNVFSQKSIRIFGANIAWLEIYIILISIAALIFFDIFHKKTKTGRALTATAHNVSASELMGINTTLMINSSWWLGGLIAAISGILMANEMYITPDIGLHFTFKALTAAFIGGIGNPKGAIIGGLIIGIIETFSLLILPSGCRDIIVFSLLLVVFSIRPTGILGGKIIEKV